MDGNNSLKRIAKVADRQIADLREFSESDYYLPASFVDNFKDEVKHRAPPKHIDGTSPESGDEWEDIEGDPEDEGTAADLAADDPIKECTRNWSAAAADEKKRMWGIFDESGVFAAA